MDAKASTLQTENYPLSSWTRYINYFTDSHVKSMKVVLFLLQREEKPPMRSLPWSNCKTMILSFCSLCYLTCLYVCLVWEAQGSKLVWVQTLEGIGDNIY